MTGYNESDSFDRGSYEPNTDAHRQKVHAFSILGHSIRPELFAASEGKRHALGFGRMLRELIDVQPKLSAALAYDCLKILTHGYAFMMVAVARCGVEFAEEFASKHGGVGMSFKHTFKDEYSREVTVGDVVINIVKKMGVDKETYSAWESIADVDEFMQSAVRPKAAEKATVPRSVVDICEFLNSLIFGRGGKFRVSFLMEDDTSAAGWVVKTGDCAFAVVKRSDSNLKYPVDLSRVKLIQTTTVPNKTLFTAK